jgi:non-ribosomal peptide synthetase component F
LSSARTLFNAYGPTETTVCATVGQCDPDLDRFDIGRPLPGLSVYVLDQFGNLQPAGILGELYVGGVGLALGYLNRPDLTEGRFVANPVLGAPHPRLYRTGDRSMFRRPVADTKPDLVFLGRLDDQLELRGFRVEPGEVEHCLRRHDAVAEAAVVGFPREKPDRLVAYVVLEDGKYDPAFLR